VPIIKLRSVPHELLAFGIGEADIANTLPWLFLKPRFFLLIHSHHLESKTSGSGGELGIVGQQEIDIFNFAYRERGR
jgi:hypothetical protein